MKKKEDIPVYLFTGFLESGKTNFIRETLDDPRFQDGERTLLLICEEGMEEYDPKMDSAVHPVMIEDPAELTEKSLSGLVDDWNAERVIIEYNGMWELDKLFLAMPENWIIYQEMTLFNSKTFLTYNKNMRQQTYDKLRTADTVVFNRYERSFPEEEFHKIVRGANSRSSILYEFDDGHVEEDDIEDPMPYDLDAPVVEIADPDYAIWYRDMGERIDKYNGKTVRFKAICANSSKLPQGVFVVGREVMTCCEADIRPAGLACEMNGPRPKPRSWVYVTARIEVKKSPAYNDEVGPVMVVQKLDAAEVPEQIVTTFY